MNFSNLNPSLIDSLRSVIQPKINKIITPGKDYIPVTGKVLDEEDIIPARYVLEVSSPGIERQLYSLDDFEKFAGKLVKVKTKEAIDGQKTFVGTLLNVDGPKVTVEDRTRGEISFDYNDIEKANLKIDLSKEFKGR